MTIKTGKEKCKEIIEFLKENGVQEQASRTDLEKAIMNVAGTSDRTIRQYIKALQILNFVSTPNNKVFYLVKEEEK